MLAAIEIYNKPQIAYRDECFVILLVNAWELLLKAILSKNKQRIFYPKKRNEPYRTFSLKDALRKTEAYLRPVVPYEPVARNLDLLVVYRDNAIHFYNQQGFGVIIYGLAQTSIVNYHDIMLAVFDVDIADEMTISLIPLAFGPQPDPIEFLQKANADPPKNKAVADFLKLVTQTAQQLESQSLDTSRFLTVYKVNLQSIKKIESADIVVAVTGLEDGSDRLLVQRRVDPNVSHPLYQKDILEEIGPELQGVTFSSYTFQAIAWKKGIKDSPHLCWRLDSGGVVRYSRDVIPLLKRLLAEEIWAARNDYKEHMREVRAKNKEAKQQAGVGVHS